MTAVLIIASVFVYLQIGYALARSGLIARWMGEDTIYGHESDFVFYSMIWLVAVIVKGFYLLIKFIVEGPYLLYNKLFNKDT